MSEHLKAHAPGTSYFCTLTVVAWPDVFTRRRNNPVEDGSVTLPEH